VLVKCLCRCSQPRVLRGLVLRASATASRASVLWALRSVPFGKYCRNSPLVFSFVPRCTGCAGRRNRRPGPCRSSAVHAATSPPPDPRSATVGAAPASCDRARDAVADCLSAMPGQRRPVLHASVYAVLRHPRQVQQHREPRRALTSVPIAELSNPRMRSPSQWPGTTRSATSAGRSLIMISGTMNDLPRPRVRARGTRNARPVRRQAVSSRRRAPRPCT